MKTQLAIFETTNLQNISKNIVNVASIPQRSPFRYPGGKTWLIPIVREWLMQTKKVSHLIEPFAGGGIVSLTAAFENLAEHITMVEIDKEIAAVWNTILSGKNKWLADKILKFNLTHENIKAELEKEKKQIKDIAFCTILKNRVFHGGILAKGAGLVKKGENGKGLRSRWYPNTLKNRILTINYIKDKISFYKDDGFKIIEQYKKNPNIFFFIDPPYTIAGRRLYNCYDINHEKLFSLTAEINGKFLLTYDNTEQIRDLAAKYNLQYKITPMRTTHHLEKNEIVISDNFQWWPDN